MLAGFYLAVVAPEVELAVCRFLAVQDETDGNVGLFFTLFGGHVEAEDDAAAFLARLYVRTSAAWHVVAAEKRNIANRATAKKTRLCFASLSDLQAKKGFIVFMFFLLTICLEPTYTRYTRSLARYADNTVSSTLRLVAGLFDDLRGEGNVLGILRNVVRVYRRAS